MQYSHGIGRDRDLTLLILPVKQFVRNWNPNELLAHCFQCQTFWNVYSRIQGHARCLICVEDDCTFDMSIWCSYQFNPPHLCVCPNPGFPTLYVMVFTTFNGLILVGLLTITVSTFFSQHNLDGRLRTKPYDKRDDFNFPIVNFPFICSSIPAASAYGVYISQLIRYFSVCGSYPFLDRVLLLTRKLLNQGFLLVKLKSSLRKFCGHHHDLVDRYGISVSQVTTDMFHLS